MNGRYLLDTNIVVALFRAELTVREKVSQSHRLYVSVVVVAELYYGALASRQAALNLQRIHQFIAASVVLPSDLETARQYSEIKIALRTAGKPIPDNDIWIAAAARQHGLPLVSRDGHFTSIAGLSSECW